MAVSQDFEAHRRERLKKQRLQKQRMRRIRLAVLVGVFALIIILIIVGVSKCSGGNETQNNNNAENTVCRGASLQVVLSPAETDNNPPDALSPANRTNFPLLQKLCRSGAHRLLLKGWPKSVLLFPTLSGEDCDLSSGIF